MPRTVVVIPTWNGAARVSRAIYSVLAQTDRDLECIVVDDGSTDETVEIVSGLGAVDGRVRLLSMARNAGAYEARAQAIECSDSEWLAFLDDDDEWLPGKLATAHRASGSHAHFFHHTAVVDVRPTGGETYRFTDARSLPDFCVADPVATSTVVLSRGLYDAVGGFDRSSRRYGDWDLWIRCAEQAPVHADPTVTCRVMLRAGSLQRGPSRPIVDARWAVIERNEERLRSVGLYDRAVVEHLERAGRRFARDRDLRETWAASRQLIRRRELMRAGRVVASAALGASGYDWVKGIRPLMRARP